MNQNVIDETINVANSKRVWIGDPCYVISDKLWEDVCDQIFEDHKEVGFKIIFTDAQLEKAYSKDAIDNLSEKAFIQCGTAYGDGCFASMSRFEYGVDAGCLAVVPDYLIAEENAADAERLGMFFDVTASWVGLKTDGNGTFTFYTDKGTFEEIYTGEEDG